MKNNATPTRFWSGYATALGGLAVAGAAPSADASILYTDIVDLTMSTVNDRIEFDLDHSSAGPSYATLNGAQAGADFQLRSTGSTDVTTALSFGSNQMAGYYLSKLSAGATIDASQPWNGGVSYFEFFDTGNWQGGADAYLGLRVNHGVDFNYGWAHVVYDDVANTMTLKEFAIEQTLNTAIAAGDVGTPANAAPEPGSLFLAALGLGGLGLRRRRAAQAA